MVITKLYLSTIQINSLMQQFLYRNGLTPKNILKKTVRKNTNTTRSGRIDIAILDSRPFFDIPICAIEVKGNAPCKSLLFSDIRRNLEYFKHTGPTGNSSLGLALNCSFHSYNDSTKKITALQSTIRKT